MTRSCLLSCRLHENQCPKPEEKDTEKKKKKNCENKLACVLTLFVPIFISISVVLFNIPALYACPKGGTHLDIFWLVCKHFHGLTVIG